MEMIPYNSRAFIHNSLESDSACEILTITVGDIHHCINQMTNCGYTALNRYTES